MLVFLSWSGSRSKAVAEELYKWLPRVLQAARPWMSASDIYAGNRWLIDISSRLDECDFGIVVVTPENAEAQWLNFEAGALSKRLETARLIPFLVGFEKKTDLEGPLAPFQSVMPDLEGLTELAKSLNDSLERPVDDDVYEDMVKAFGPTLIEAIAAIPEPVGTPKAATRDTESMVAELLELVRALPQTLRPVDQPPRDEFQEFLLANVASPRRPRAPGLGPDIVLNEGDVVSHSTWGRGVVRGVSGEREKRRVRIVFGPEIGAKELLVRYAPIEVVANDSRSEREWDEEPDPDEEPEFDDEPEPDDD